MLTRPSTNHQIFPEVFLLGTEPRVNEGRQDLCHQCQWGLGVLRADGASQGRLVTSGAAGQRWGPGAGGRGG